MPETAGQFPPIRHLPTPPREAEAFIETFIGGKEMLTKVNTILGYRIYCSRGNNGAYWLRMRTRSSRRSGMFGSCAKPEGVAHDGIRFTWNQMHILEIGRAHV